MSTKQMEVRVSNLDCDHDAAAIEHGLLMITSGDVRFRGMSPASLCL